MKRVLQLAFFLIPAGLLAAPQEEQNTVLFDHNQPALPIGLKLDLLTDTAASLTINDVLGSKQFRPSSSPVPNLGVSKAAHWARFTLVNTDPTENVVLLVDFPEIEEVDIYQQDTKGIRHILSAGQARPLHKADQESPSFRAFLDVPYGGTGIFYIRVKSEKQLQLPIYVMSRLEFSRTILNRGLFMGGYFGIMLVMILYNLFIFISISDRSYALYVISITFNSITQLSFLGYLGYYLLGNNVWMKEHASLILTVCTAISANIFMSKFIHASRHIRKFNPVMYTFYGLMAIGVFLDLVGYRIEAYGLVQATSLVLALYVFGVAFIASRHGERSARYFLSAWCVFLVGIVIFVAKDWGLVAYNDLTTHMMTIGSAMEVVLLSFGLADKINVLRRDKERSQAEALSMAKENARMVQDQNQLLERKVAERTQALEESNRHLKNTQSKLVSVEKMASLGQITAGIAHEINNPLNFISSNIPPLKRNLTDMKAVLDRYREAAKDDPGMAHIRDLEKQVDLDYTIGEVAEIMDCIENGASRTSEIVRGLRTFSRLDEDDLKMADVNDGMRSTVVVLGPQLRDAVKIEFDLGELPEVECYPGKLNQVFMNLLNNAAHAVKQRHGRDGGKIRIATRAQDGQVTITIADNGIGMDETVQRRLFEPFFTTKGVGEGTGLGLSICQGIVEKHHGTLELESTPGVGSTFVITLPATQAAHLAKSA